MIIETLILHNFGVYEGRHEVSLRPRGNKRITLIGALNGSGKTTLLEGIQICLFGRSSKFILPSKGAYTSYLSEAINRRRRNESAAVTVVFQSGTGGRGTIYEVTRTWGASSRGVDETLQVLVNGALDLDATERWAEISERILPSQLSDLFFFDGERIEALAEPARCSQMIREGLSNLLGLDLITDLDRSLVVLDRRIRSEGLSPEIFQRLQALDAQRQLIEQQTANLQSEKLQTLEALSDVDAQMGALRRDLASQGGELLSRRDEFRSKKTVIDSEISALRLSLVEQAEGCLPLAMLSDPVSALLELASSAISPERAEQMELSLDSVTKRLVESLAQRGLVDFGSRDSALELAKIIVESEMALKQSTSIEVDHHNVSSIQSAVTSARTSSTKLLIKLQAHTAESSRIDRLLKAVPEGDKVDHLVHSLRALEERQTEHQRFLSVLDEQGIRLRKDLEDIELKMQRVLGEQREFEAQQLLTERMKGQLIRARKHLDAFQDRMRGRHISLLENLILDGLKTLYRKQGFVKAVRIDPSNYSITLELEGEGTVPAAKLSAAERQLLAVSVLWGLARASGRPLPTIIDTPLGRLDSKHRAMFVERYFPKAAKQVILLSTDEEVVGRYYDMLKPYIANEYVLSYDEASQSSTIRQGYFEAYEEAA